MEQSMIRKPVLMARYLCSRRYYCAYNDVLPLPYRCALAWRSRTRLEIRDGDFSVGIRDADFQVIPTAWVLAAEARWKPDGARVYP
jgi:hypothetical protein